MDSPITDAESTSEEPLSFDEPPENESPTATIVYHQGSEEVSDFFFIEERGSGVDPYSDEPDSATDQPYIRVWWDDPKVSPDDYTDYPLGRITDVSP